MKRLFFLTLLLITGGLYGQFSDDFADGSFLSDPAWSGDTDRFTITGGELQLFDPAPSATNTAYLVAEAPTAADSLTRWNCYVRLEFPPSANNLARFYLSSNSSHLGQPLNGYFLEIGGSNDNLTLYRQDGDALTPILAGTPGVLADAPAVARVEITRSPFGQWVLYADYGGGQDFQLIGTADDDTHPGGQYVGFFCRYTTTRSDKFFFDDVFVDPLFTDTAPPEVLSAAAAGPSTIRLTFDEALSPPSATLATNYSINNGIGNPLAAAIDPGEPAQVVLTLDAELVSATSYTVFMENIADTNGNAGGAQNVSFTYYNIQPIAPGDLLITEIMADPAPVVGLPDAEYLELYNRSDKYIDLSTLRFDSGGSPQTLSSYILGPLQYVTLCPAAEAAAFQSLTPVVTVPGGLALNNSGDVVSLTGPSGSSLSQIEYERSWYNDPDRDDGGYALELIDRHAPASCGGNWRASLDPTGGTPGRPNSVAGSAPDQSPPALRQVAVIDPAEVLLTFNEPLADTSALDPGRYQINNGPDILDILLLDGAEEVLLVLAEALEPRTFYSLTVGAGLRDCLGNTAADTLLTIARAEAATPGDLLITEIMADPNGASGLPAVEYIELYNRSEKFIATGGLRFATRGTPRSLPPALLLPGEYLLVCDEAGAGALAPFGPTLPLPGFPALVNSGDELILSEPDGTTLIHLAYDTRWYADDIRSGGGWSLELINRDGPAACRHNWRASLDPAGGTPGKVNSVDGQPPESIAVDLLQVVPLTDQELQLRFSRSLDPQTAAAAAAYRLQPDPGINELEVLLPAAEAVRLTLATPLLPDQRYTLTVADPLTDCLGNPAGSRNNRDFGLPQPALGNDLIINEVLFFPAVGGADFIELYNRSAKVINLRGLEVRNQQKLTGNNIQTVATDYLLLPGDYALLTEDPADIQARYQTGGPETFLQTGLPTLDRDAGNITLRLSGLTIDSFDYSDDLHFSLLDDERGVSLERLDPEAPTNSPGNWHSAAAVVGFATPGYQNSSFLPTPDLGSSIITIPETTFSPDGDGYQETLNIFYQADRPGYVLNATVFDAQGRPVRRLLQNQTLAAEGSFSWDGATDDRQKARIGIYIIWIELFHPDGYTEHYKKTCVLAGRLD